MKRLLAVLVVLNITGVIAADAPPKGRNCDLAEPPTSSGEDTLHGATLKIFPRARDISKGYTGCQVMWVPDGTKWLVLSLTYIEKGSAVRIWFPLMPNHEAHVCRYRNGRVIAGNKDDCPMAEFLIHESMDVGCVQRGWVSEQAAGRCNYE